MIFVNIASYRDSELIPTVLNLFENASKPKQLRVVVAWQHDDNEQLTPIKDLVEVIDIPYTESKGVCWARSLLQNKYNDEEYTLQLDSHHRFIKNWDVELIRMYNQCKNMGSELPLITSYLPNYDDFKEILIDEVWQMRVEKFMDEGPLFFVPEPIANYKELTAPIPARFYSGHFAFTDGQFNQTVKYDSDYYFYGEETNMAVRAFTHGYDLYHPHKVIAWHQYDRSYRPTHWNDHQLIGHEWWQLDKKATQKFSKDFGILKKTHNKSIFGSVRTLKDYETYAGIRFCDKYISEYTLSNLPPPNTSDI